jgi:hypothetical protein
MELLMKAGSYRIISSGIALIAVSFLLSSHAFGAITGVTRLGGSTNCAPALGGTLTEGSTSYCDQSYTWTTFPPEADDAILDYVVVSDADNAVGDYGLLGDQRRLRQRRWH